MSDDAHRQADPHDRSGAAGASGPAEGAGPAGAGPGGAGQGAAPVTIPDRAGYLTGWRVWRITTQGYLTAAARTAVWPKREPFIARCEVELADANPSHVAPVESCTCGIYAYKTRELLLSGLQLADSVIIDSGMALGEVALWGRVVETELGYRAARAYPLGVTISSRHTVAVARLLEEYGVPVHLFALPAPASVPLLASMLPVPPSLKPPTTRGTPVRRMWIVESSPMPSTMYRWPMPLGMLYRTIEMGAMAAGIIRYVELIANGSFQLVSMPLFTCGRDSGGNFVVYDGLRDGTGLDTRRFATLEVVVQTEARFPVSRPIVLGYLCHA